MRLGDKEMSQGHIPSHKFISEKHKTKGTLEAEKLLQEIAIFFLKKDTAQSLDEK